jgi:hypothetical protein
MSNKTVDDETHLFHGPQLINLHSTLCRAITGMRPHHRLEFQAIPGTDMELYQRRGLTRISMISPWHSWPLTARTHQYTRKLGGPEAYFLSCPLPKATYASCGKATVNVVVAAELPTSSIQKS